MMTTDYATETAMANAVLVLAREMANLADAVNHLAVASQAARTPPGAAKPPAGAGSTPPGPAPATGPPGGGSGDAQVKRGKKIYAICRQNEWDIKGTGEQITGHVMDPNSQKWSEADQAQVLDQFAEWGYK
jgi:uncharacterized protein (DUF2147 family)